MTIELAKPTEFRLAFEPRDPSEARGLAKVAVESKFFNVRNEAEALIVMMVGRELGLSAMQALRGIYVVQGKPVVSSDTLVAAVMMSGLAEYWQPIKSTNEECTIETKRKGALGPVRQTWTIEDAKRAGLANKDVWKAYAKDMLRHRCAAGLVREVYPDVALGCYVPGELDEAQYAAERAPNAGWREGTSELVAEEVQATTAPVKPTEAPKPPPASVSEPQPSNKASHLVGNIKRSDGKGLLALAKEVAMETAPDVHNAYCKRWSELIRGYEQIALMTAVEKMKAIPEELRSIDAWNQVNTALAARGIPTDKTHVDAEDMGAPTLAEEGSST